MKIVLKEGQKVLDKAGNTYIIERGDSLHEGATMTVGEFLSEIEDAYHDFFPDSFCSAGIWKSLGTNILIRCYFAKDKNEVPNKIMDNDLFSLDFLIQDLPDGLTEDSPMPESIRYDGSQMSITTKPTQKYMAFGREKITFRKFIGSPEKFIDSATKHFAKFYDTTVRLYNENMIPDSITELVDMSKKI
jgi:hypothetical protein